jgi:hypothetical protein
LEQTETEDLLQFQHGAWMFKQCDKGWQFGQVQQRHPSVHQVPWETQPENRRAINAEAALTFADVFIVEVFCGKAGLSRALRRKGFQAFFR